MKQLIDAAYPTLHLTIENETVYIRGSLFLTETATKQEIDRYSIEIEIPVDYPKSIPKVREIGDKIPKIIDRHINIDGTACLFIPEERWKYYPKGASIVDFIAGPISQFFMSQSYFEITGNWLFGQRKHGIGGLLEFYSEILGTTNILVIRKFVEYLIKPKVKGHWHCYCGSQKLLRHCHLKKVFEYRSKISVETTRESLNKLR